MLEEPTTDSVSRFVVRNRLLLIRAQDAALPLEANNYTLNSGVKVDALDVLGTATRRMQRSLVTHVRNVRTREAGREHRELVRKVLLNLLDVLGEAERLQVHLEDALAARDVGAVDGDVAIETAWPHERGVQHVGPVGTGEDDDVLIRAEAIHLDEELVQR